MLYTFKRDNFLLIKKPWEYTYNYQRIKLRFNSYKATFMDYEKVYIFLILKIFEFNWSKNVKSYNSFFIFSTLKIVGTNIFWHSASGRATTTSKEL